MFALATTSAYSGHINLLPMIPRTSDMWCSIAPLHHSHLIIIADRLLFVVNHHAFYRLFNGIVLGVFKETHEEAIHTFRTNNDAVSYCFGGRYHSSRLRHAMTLSSTGTTWLSEIFCGSDETIIFRLETVCGRSPLLAQTHGNGDWTSARPAEILRYAAPSFERARVHLYWTLRFLLYSTFNCSLWINHVFDFLRWIRLSSAILNYLRCPGLEEFGSGRLITHDF